jgi:hypothetical protein
MAIFTLFKDSFAGLTILGQQRLSLSALTIYFNHLLKSLLVCIGPLYLCVPIFHLFWTILTLFLKLSHFIFFISYSDPMQKRTVTSHYHPQAPINLLCLYSFSNWSLVKSVKATQWRKDNLLKKWCYINWTSICKNKSQHTLYIIQKSVQNHPRPKHKTIRLLEETKGKIFIMLGLVMSFR